MTSIKEFTEEIQTEREHQVERWADGSEENLDAIDSEKNDPIAFTAYIAHHSSRWFPGGFPPYDKATLLTFRSQMVKVATLAYAAVRWVDQNLADEEFWSDK